MWDRRVRSDSSGLLASYRPSEELAQGELTCPFVIPSDEDWPTALTDLGPACPLGLWVRGREHLARLTDSAVAVIGNRVPTEQAVTRAHDFAAALAEAGHTITATLAYGVDSTAHQAAAETGAASLAILPRGLDGAHPHTRPAAAFHRRQRQRRGQPLPARHNRQRRDAESQRRGAGRARPGGGPRVCVVLSPMGRLRCRRGRRGSGCPGVRRFG